MQKILIALVVAGCGRGPEPVLSGGGAPLAIDGAAVVEVTPVDAAPPPEKSPPTGMYALSTDVTDCSGKKTSSSFEQPLFVQVKHDKGKTWINVPLIISAGGGAQARSDVGLEAKQRSVAKSPTCPGLETVIETEVTKTTHDTIRVVRTETFGDGSKCPSPPPESKCTRETVLTFGLKKSMCEGPCNAANVRLTGDGGVDLECKCP